MKTRLLILSLAALCLSATPAVADMYGTVKVDFINVAPMVSTGIHYSGGTMSPNTGVYNLALTDVAGVPASWMPYLDGDVDSFCIDLYDLVADGSVTYDVKSLDAVPEPFSTPGYPPYEGMGTVRAAYMSELLDKYWTDAYLNTGVADTDKIHAAALQLAIWEIVDEGRSTAYEPPVPSAWDLGAGNFRADNSTLCAEGNLLLADILLDGAAVYTGTYVGLSNPITADAGKSGYQDFVVRVPVPGAVLLGLLGLSVAGARLRKRS